MAGGLRITEVERIVLDVPFRPRIRPWNALLVGQWRVVELIRVTTDAGFVGWGETLPHYTWGTVSDAAVARVQLQAPGLPGARAAPASARGAGG